MTIRNCCNKNCTLSFKKIVEPEVMKESLSSVIPTKIITEFGDLLAIFINENFNLYFYTSKGEFLTIISRSKHEKYISRFSYEKRISRSGWV